MHKGVRDEIEVIDATKIKEKNLRTAVAFYKEIIDERA